jgi:hypothetical protein
LSTAVKRSRAGWFWKLGWGLCLLIAVLVSALWLAVEKGAVQWIYRDGESVYERGAPVRQILWKNPVELQTPEVAGAAATPQDATPLLLVTTRLVVAQKTARGDYDLFVKERNAGGWRPTRPLVPEGHVLRTEYNELDPSLSIDGQSLCFASDRPGGLGGYDLYRSERVGDDWSPPVPLTALNSPFDDSGPALHPSGRLLVFATARPRTFLLSPPANWQSVLFKSWEPQPSDLAFVMRDPEEDAPWGPLGMLAGAETDSTETQPCFSPGGDFLYFSSDRPGGRGGFDLYRSRVLLDKNELYLPELSAISSLGPSLNSSLDDLDPEMFLEGFAIAYRVRDPESGLETLLESRSREVDSELEFASIPLRVLLRRAGRLGWMLLLGLMLFVGLVVLFRYRHTVSVTLLARCAALALVFHAVLLYGFYFWRIGQSIVALSREEFPSEVTVEGVLQARISLEATRMGIDMPDPSSRAVDAALAPRVPSVSDAVTLETPTPRAVTQPRAEPALPIPLEVPEVALAEAPQTPRPVAPLPVAPVPFQPQVEQRELEVKPVEEARPEFEAATDSAAPKSIRLAADAPTQGELDADATLKAESLPLAEDVPFLPEATTPVQAPTEPTPVLPPEAKRNPAPAVVVVSELPVPAQAQSQAEATLSPPSASSAVLAPAPTVAPEAVATPETRRSLASDQVSWEASPAGVQLADSSLQDAKELPVAEIVPISTPAPMAGTRLELPDTTAIAEVAQDSAKTTPTAAPTSSPRQSADERVAPDGAEGKLTRAVLKSPRVVLEASPRVAPSSAVQAVPLAAPLPLQSRARPGASAPAPRVSAGAASRTPVVRLPEGEGGAAPAEGAPELADVLSPRPSAPRRLTSVPPSARPSPRAPLLGPRRSSPPPPLPPTRGSDAAEPAVAAPARAGSPTGAVASLPPAETAVASAGLLALPPREELPELPPEVLERKDLSEVRAEKTRKILVERLGGTPESEAAVGKSLDWLARHQSADGHWDVDGFDRECRGCRNPGIHSQCDSALTALTILCFLGQNHSPTNPESPYRGVVARAIEWLLAHQREDGLFGSYDRRFTMYGHGMATLAIGEAYLLTKDERLREPLAKAAKITVGAQNPTTGGWRYKPEPPLRGDTSITGWQVLALTSARDGGVEIPEATFERARHWLDVEVSSGVYAGIYGYTKPSEPRVAMVAEGMYARQLLGSRVGDRNLDESARYIYTETRRGGYLDNLYLIYYGTLALYHYQGWIWEKWNEEVRGFLVRTQQNEGRLRGSWNPTGTWSSSGGRVLSTVLATLSLEVYYRYLPLYWRAQRGAAKR